MHGLQYNVARYCLESVKLLLEKGYSITEPNTDIFNQAHRRELSFPSRRSALPLFASCVE
jgi:hypothetical protein